MLFWDGRNIGTRKPYNGVLLLDTILQTPVVHEDDPVRLECPLSEALLLLFTLQSLDPNDPVAMAAAVACVNLAPGDAVANSADMQNELTARIDAAEEAIAAADALLSGQVQPEGIKAQKWRTVCLELPQGYFKTVIAALVGSLIRLGRNVPALTVASSVSERLTDLLVGGRMLEAVAAGAATRALMHAEATRRQTFARWPHMDYKWALPEQMAQAGFYHQPSATGDDRAMCFTCNVCLVCWEKTDEPWGEHERHSPACPFVLGEYTQNVPLVVTYATDAAVAAGSDDAGNQFDVMSTGTDTNVVCSARSSSGQVTLWSVRRQLRRCGSFEVFDDVRNMEAHRRPTTAASPAAGDRMRLHAISTFRSWEPEPTPANCNGLRMVCAVTAADRQYLVVYRAGKVLPAMAAKVLLQTALAVPPPLAEQPMTTPKIDTYADKHNDEDDNDDDDDPEGPSMNWLDNEDMVMAEPKPSKYVDFAAPGGAFSNLQAAFAKHMLAKKKSFEAGSLTESVTPEEPGDVVLTDCEPGDVRVHFLDGLQITPLLEGRHDITDLVLSYDNKFVLVRGRFARL